jgi:hypothetical protein
MNRADIAVLRAHRAGAPTRKVEAIIGREAERLLEDGYSRSPAIARLILEEVFDLSPGSLADIEAALGEQIDRLLDQGVCHFPAIARIMLEEWHKCPEPRPPARH